MRKTSPFRIFKQATKDGTATWRARFFAEDGSILKSVTLSARTKPAAYREAQSIFVAGGGLRRESDPNACDYIIQAWTLGSDYLTSRSLRGRTISNQYIDGNRRLVENHGKIFLGNRTMSEVDSPLLENLMVVLSRKGKGPRVINRLIQAIRVPLGYWCRANRRSNPIVGLEKLDEHTAERGILDLNEISQLSP